jgi:hypothetical protein
MSIASNPKTPTSLSIRIQYYDSAWYDMTAQELKTLFDADGSSSYVKEFTTQQEAPLTGESVTIAPGEAGGNTLLDLRPAGTIATLNVIFPSSNIGTEVTVDKQEIILTAGATVTAVSLVGNGATIRNAVTTLASGDYARYKYDTNYRNWNRIG